MTYVHKDYARAIQSLMSQFAVNARPVHTQHWQGVDISSKPEMMTYEWLHPSFAVEMTGYDFDLEAMQRDIQANWPWCRDHFFERVCGWPINPGVQWKKWPYGHSAEKFLENGKFNHNYMERYWPKYAGHDKPTYTAEDYQKIMLEGHPDKPLPHWGIKYEYGDLNDLVDLLAHDPLTRQAYLPIWFPEDTGGGSKRAPCTLGYHFIMRNGFLDITYYIRSCDFLRHFRDDVFLTHALAGWVWHQLRECGDPVWKDVQLGRFTMHITSLHVFANDWRTMFPELDPPK